MMIITFAAPVFVALLLLEWRRRPAGYERRDTVANLAMGVGNRVLVVGWVVIELALLGWLHDRSVLDVGDGVAAWAVALLGVGPELIAAAWALNLLYQFWIHTELIDRMPRWFEATFNTPSHHRVHHGKNPEYLDKNYAGVLIVWDRWFGTFEPELAPVRYGLTKDISTHNPFRIATHELVAIARDVRAATTWGERFGRVFRGPGWSPTPSLTTLQLQEAVA